MRPASGRGGDFSAKGRNTQEKDSAVGATIRRNRQKGASAPFCRLRLYQKHKQIQPKKGQSPFFPQDPTQKQTKPKKGRKPLF